VKFRWNISPAQPLLAGNLASRLRISTTLAQCLLNRGLSEPDSITRFLDPRLKHLADPFLLPNMAAAVDRLLMARNRAERLVIFGDYDVDGVTSTSLLCEALGALGWQVDHYLPHRRDEGYGLSRDGVENCLRKFPATLLLAVDCGSTAGETIAWLRERGVDVIVLDHHQVSDPAPTPVALVNPQLSAGDAVLPRSAVPFTELCSAGLAFKLAHAILKRGRETGLPGASDYDLRPLLDLVALGTIADIVPLTGENRILVPCGLERLNVTKRPGLVALKEVAQSPEVLGPTDVGFQLAPRLNAAGRLETAEESLRLLLATDLEEAMPIAQALDARNRERQAIERAMSEQATGAVRARFNPETDFVIVEGQPTWHIGVVGIVASRVLQQFYRPTIIVGGDGDNWRGSGRSIAGFDLAAALRECSEFLVRHGGHAMAAGLTIHPGKLDAFRSRLNEVACRTLKPEDMHPPLRLDAEVGLGDVSLDEITKLNRMQPFGQGNPAVQFFARGLGHSRPLQRMGKDRQHVKFWATDGRSTHECIWWNAGEGSLPVGRFDLAYTPQINHYNGKTSVQLKVLDWRPAQ
jgi:single-stranded-DNA-specific exonuclease